MTVERLWVLAFCWLPLAWAAWDWKRSPRRLALLLKAFALTAILLALAEPRLSVTTSKMAVSVLVDTSASLSPADLDRASSLVEQIYRARGRHAVRVIPFARRPRPPAAAEIAGGWKLRYSEGEHARATNLEAAINEALSEQPAGMVPRLVLVSDGLQNQGSAARAAWQARELGVPIDTIPLQGRPRPELRLDSASLPLQVFAGERFPLDLAVNAPRPAEAEVEILASGKSLGVDRVRLESGANLVRVHARLATTGAVDLVGLIRAPGLGEVRFAQAVTVRRPRVLLVTQDPPGAEKHLVQVLEGAQFQVERKAEVPDGKLDLHQIIVLNNLDLESLPGARKQSLADFVRAGGGLLVIGGENNVYVDKKGLEDPLEQVLPARLAPPRTPEGVAVVLVLDKSSSMEGRKIELARLAAIGVIEHLRPIDLIGILIFDNSFHWIVPIRKADDRNLLKRLVSGVMADGGTQIAPALQEAYRRILPVRANYKHIVLLTDGISEEGDSMALARDAVANRVTISTVGLGQDVNRSFLERLALTARGKAYLMADPSALEQILIRDVMEHTGTTAVEKQFRPIVVKRTEFFEKLAVESAPPLLGYVRFIARPTADLLLKADERDPLLVRWQYGLGRAAVFTSDAKSRWAAGWVGWEGFDHFWANLFRDLLPKAPEGEAVLRYDRATGELAAEYRLAPHLEAPAEPPEIFLLGDQGVRGIMRLEKAAPGLYRGRVHVGAARGMFRVRPLEESRAFPETGVYLEEAELADYGSNPALLKQLSALTGGRFAPSPRQIFEHPGRSVPRTWRLWPALLTLALLLNLVELVMRKGPGVAESLRGSRPHQRETIAA
jgi:uncharacterized membrane protein